MTAAELELNKEYARQDIVEAYPDMYAFISEPKFDSYDEWADPAHDV